MDDGGDFRPGRDFIIALAISVAAGTAIFSAPDAQLLVMHTILNTGIALAVAASIAAAAPTTSIIMLTGWGQRLVASGEVPAHVVAVPSKPPNRAHLRHRLAGCVAEQLEQDRA